MMKPLFVYAQTIVALLLSALVVGSVQAQGFARGPKYAVVSASASPVSIKPGGHGTLVVKVVIDPKFHINSAHPKDPNLIATVFQGSSIGGIKFGTPKYPADHSVTTSSGTVAAYTGTAEIDVPFTVATNAKHGNYSLNGSLTYQGCNANACFPPKSDKISAELKVK
jgi:hypothetical protein